MKRFFVILSCTAAVISLLGIVFVIGIAVYARSNSVGAVDDELFDSARLTSSTGFYVLNGDGEPEEVWRDESGGIKTWYSFSEISDFLKDGFISSEDRGFYEHSGVDLKRTAFALLNTLLHVKPRFGASTITQQLIKNLSGDSEITMKRKLNEIIRAYNLENHHSKDEIFELYLNIVPMSNNIYGVGAASEMYFGKLPSELTLSEAALLVGIINSPRKYDPIKHPDEATRKRNNVLCAMLDNGVISDKQYNEAKEAPLGVSLSKETSYNPMPWYVEAAYNEIVDDLEREYSVSRQSAVMLLKGSKVILNMENGVQEILDRYFEDENNLPMEVSDGLKYSMVVINNQNGCITAEIGGVGKKRADKILDYSSVPIIPGSALKPIALYAPLVDSGEINPSTVFDDVPIEYKEQDGVIIGYPKNSPNVYEGSVCLSDAIAFSKNTAAVRVYRRLGASAIVNSLRNNYMISGICDGDYYESPLALGQLTRGISLKELTRAYTVFPRDGIISVGKHYKYVLKKDGESLIKSRDDARRVISKKGARMMNQLLMGPVERGTARTVDLKYLIDTAGKTGTSGGSKDKVFIGYTPYYTIGIWCGYADGRRSVGSVYPSHLKIWDDIATEIHKVGGLLNDPVNFSCDGLVPLRFSPETGITFREGDIGGDSGSMLGYFLPEFLPEINGGKTEENEEYALA